MSTQKITLKKIILVYKTHFDIGFTDLSENVIAKYSGDMLQDVITTCKGTQALGKLKYVWTMPAWPLLHIVNNCPPDLKRELDDLIRNDQVVWHALPFTSHTDCCSQMEYIEGLNYAKKLSDIYRKPYLVSGKMTDVPGHSIMLPDILSQAGIRFLHIGCNEFATPPEVPELFYWESSEKRRVLTMYSKGGYGTGLTPPEDWAYPVWMALMHTHDNCGPQSAETINKICKQLQEQYPGVEVVSGTMDDFYYELEQCDLSNVPVVKKDMADTWIHGINSYPKEVALMRENRRRMEKLQARYAKRLFEGWERACDVEKLLDGYYGEVCLFEEHTWGADVKTWIGADRVYEKREFLKKKESDAYQFMERSWEEQRERAYTADAYKEKLEQLLGESPKPPMAGGIIAAADTCACVQPEGLRAICVESNIKVGNCRFELLFSKQTGQILELKDKVLDQVVMKAREKESIFSYRYDKYGYSDINEYLRQYGYHFTAWGILDYGREDYPFCGHETFYPSFVKYEIEGRKLALFYETSKSADKYGDAPHIQIVVTFPEEGNKLYVDLSLRRKQESPYVEAGSVFFPFAGNKAQFYVQKGGALLNVAEDLILKSNHSLYCMENGMIMADENIGVCIRSLDAPLAAIGNPGVYQYSPEYIEPEHPDLYINLFNNMWGTNFPQWIGGDLDFRFEISCFSRKGANEKKEWMEMLEGCECPEKIGIDMQNMEKIQYPESMKLIGARKSGKGFSLYFSEIWGMDGVRTFSAEGCRICLQDLMGRKEKFYENEITFNAAAYGVQCFYLESGTGRIK